MEGDSVRSRLWSLILRELPFPFREIGLEVARLVSWCDKAAARLLTGLRQSPAWSLVIVTGVTVVFMTGLLFFSFFASHDPTLGELAAEGSSYARASRASLEAAGDWSAQDRWRVAHMFVDHRP